jgi:hypothetical protein
LELRATSVAATATAVVRFDVLRDESDDVEVGGYAMVNLFATPSDITRQPTLPDEPCVVNTGCMQLPIYIGNVDPKSDVSATCMADQQYLMCASALVRHAWLLSWPPRSAAQLTIRSLLARRCV